MTDTAKPRLLSLDVLRGLTVVGMILVNSMSGMFYGPEAKVFPLLLHAKWDGLMLADVVFPGFLMMVGVAIPLAMANSRDGAGKDAGAILSRTGRLVLLGFLLSNLYWFAHFSEGAWRLFGVLQRIGLVYGACALLFIACGPRVRMGIIAAILILYWPLSLLPALDGLVPTDIWMRGHNFVGSVDRVLLGAGDHIYVKGPEGYDPEGLLGTLPAIAHGLIGVAIGEYLLKRPAGAAKTLALAGAGMLVLGVAWGFVFPVIKDIWSSTFVLVTCGITTLALAGLHAWLDREPPPTGATRAFVLFGSAFGINAIAAYVLHELTGSMIGWDAMLVPYHALKGSIGEGWAAFAPVLIYIGIIWLCVDYLRRRKWIVRI